MGSKKKKSKGGKAQRQNTKREKADRAKRRSASAPTVPTAPTPTQESPAAHPGPDFLRTFRVPAGQLPAICDQCRTVFPSGYAASGVSISFYGNKSGPCPNCGGMGSVPDGFYEFNDLVRDVVTGASAEEVAALDRTVSDSLAKRETDGKRVARTFERLADRFEKLRPVLQKLADFLRPKSGADVAQWLSVLLAFLK